MRVGHAVIGAASIVMLASKGGSARQLGTSWDCHCSVEAW